MGQGSWDFDSWDCRRGGYVRESGSCVGELGEEMSRVNVRGTFVALS